MNFKMTKNDDGMVVKYIFVAENQLNIKIKL